MALITHLLVSLLFASSMVLMMSCSKSADSNAKDEGFFIKHNPCLTNYPVLLVHGVAGRDSMLGSNYFGRIPEFLQSNCDIEVYQGKQDAFGVVEGNADQLLETVLHITDDLGWGKVNIIAHSKGGIDTRFMFYKNKDKVISGRTLNDRVASFTTLATPHRGSILADYLLSHLNDTAVNILAVFLDTFGRVVGDTVEADSEKALKILSTASMSEMNAKLGDLDNGIDGVYCQSWTGYISGLIQDPIFKATSKIMESQGSPINDGAVQEDSAIYGDYHGTVGSGLLGGVSHMAIVDKAGVIAPGISPGFDPREFYKNILADLKERGY